MQSVGSMHSKIDMQGLVKKCEIDLSLSAHLQCGAAPCTIGQGRGTDHSVPQCSNACCRQAVERARNSSKKHTAGPVCTIIPSACHPLLMSRVA